MKSETAVYLRCDWLQASVDNALTLTPRRRLTRLGCFIGSPSVRVPQSSPQAAGTCLSSRTPSQARALSHALPPARSRSYRCRTRMKLGVRLLRFQTTIQPQRFYIQTSNPTPENPEPQA